MRRLEAMIMTEGKGGTGRDGSIGTRGCSNQK